MFSLQLQNGSISGLREQPRRGPTSRGRRLAIAAAAAAAIASGGAATVAVAGHSPQVTAGRLSTGTSMPALHVGATSASFVRRLRRLEAVGYVGVACKVGGQLLFNPRTRHYVTVRA